MCSLSNPRKSSSWWETFIPTPLTNPHPGLFRELETLPLPDKPTPHTKRQVVDMTLSSWGPAGSRQGGLSNSWREEQGYATPNTPFSYPEPHITEAVGEVEKKP